MSNEKAQAIEGAAEMERKADIFKIRATKTILLIVGLLAVPCIILIGMGYGICFGVQSGAEAGIKKTSRMLRDWRESKP